MKFYNLSLLLLATLVSNAQSFNLYNSSSSKSLSPTNYVQLVVAAGENADGSECCDYLELLGYIKKVEGDSISFLAEELSLGIQSDCGGDYLKLAYIDSGPVKAIAKNDIYYLKDFKSKRGQRRKETVSTIGALAVIGGLLTGLNSIFLADNGRKDLLIASGIQIGAGLILGISTHTTRRNFKNNPDPWRIQ